MIPEGWTFKNFSEICALNYGKSLNKENYQATAHNPVYGTGGILGRIDEFLSIGPSIIIGRKGSINQPIYIPENQKFWAIDTTYFVESDQNVKFLYYLVDNIDLMKLNESTSMPSLNRNTFYALNTAIPPLPEQKRIAEVLSSVDTAIEATTAVIEQAKKVKQELLQTLLRRGIGHKHFKTSPIGEIPEKWEVYPLDDLGTSGRPAIKAGPFGSSLKKEFYVEAGYKIYGQEQVIAGDLSIGNYYIDENRFNELKSCEVQAGDILISLVGTLGKIAIVPSKFEPGIINPRLIRISPDAKKVSSEFLACWLESEYSMAYFNSTAGGGTMGVINGKILKCLPVPIPSISEQNEIVELQRSIDNQLASEITKLASLKQLKKGLMQDLLTGKVRVKAAPAIKLTENKERPHKSADDFQLTAPVEAIYKCALLRAEIITQLNDPGAIKSEKVVSLTARHNNMDETIDRTEYREAAGPYDGPSRHKIDAIFKQEKWFSIQQQGKTIKYASASNSGGYKQDYQTYLGRFDEGIQFVISLLRYESTDFCEKIATLYAVWNDFLIDGKQPSDDTIINDALAWDKSKRRFPKSDWQIALDWIRRKNLVPQGTGRKTKLVKS